MSWRLLAIIARLGFGLLLFYGTLSLIIAFLRMPAFATYSPSVPCSLSAYGSSIANSLTGYRTRSVRSGRVDSTTMTNWHRRILALANCARTT